MIVERTIELGCDQSAAFEHFTSGIDAWWPLREGFTFGADRCQSIHLEAHVGGRFFERFVDGDEFPVGVVTVCDPPHRIVFTWAPPVWPGGTEVEVRFTASGDESTTIQLEHRGFERLGEIGAETRDRFAGGWVTVLDRFAASAAR